MAMAMKPLTAEAIALTEKKMNMTLDEIIKLSKKPASKAKNHRTSNKSHKFVNGGSAQGRPIRGRNPTKVQQFMDSRASLRQGVLAQRRSNFRGNQFPLATEVARKAAVAPIRSRPINRNRNRMANWNMPRVGAPTFQRKAVGNFNARSHSIKELVNDSSAPVVERWLKLCDVVKGSNGFTSCSQQQQQQQQQTKMAVAKQRPQTMDSLFANMKQQRMRVQPNNKMIFNAQRGVGAQQQQQQRRRRPRGRFGGNFAN